MSGICFICPLCNKNFVSGTVPYKEKYEAKQLNSSSVETADTSEDPSAVNQALMRQVELHSGKTLHWPTQERENSRKEEVDYLNLSFTSGNKFVNLVNREKLREPSLSPKGRELDTASLFASLPSQLFVLKEETRSPPQTSLSDPTDGSRTVHLLSRLVNQKTSLYSPVCGGCWEQQLQTLQKSSTLLTDEVESLQRAYHHFANHSDILKGSNDAGVNSSYPSYDYFHWNTTTNPSVGGSLLEKALACSEVEQLDRELEEMNALIEEEERELRELDDTLCEVSLLEGSRTLHQERNAFRIFSETDEEKSRQNVLKTLSNTPVMTSLIDDLPRVLYPIDTDNFAGSIGGFRLMPPSCHPSVRTERNTVSVHEREPLYPLSDQCMVMNQSNYRRAVLWNCSEDKTPLTQTTLHELNTACGLTVDLIVLLARINFYEFKGALFHPRGERTTVDTLAKRSEVFSLWSLMRFGANDADEIIVSGSHNFFLEERHFFHNSFGDACTVVLRAVRELGETVGEKYRAGLSRVTQHLERVQRLLRPPPLLDKNVHHPIPDETEYTIELRKKEQFILEHYPSLSPHTPFVIKDDGIDGTSVCYGKCSDSDWTVSMKKLLLQLKWCQEATCTLQRLLLLERSIED